MGLTIGIKNVMDSFIFSALQLNYAKCQLFSFGISRDKLLEIHQVTGSKLRTLPIRYLGVPMVTKRLTDRDCSPLVEKITAKINHWASRFLSCVGRF